MISNKDITVINEENGIYFGTVVRGVSFIGKTARNATEKGLQSADYFTIRIAEHLVKDYGSFARQFVTAENGAILETESGFFFEIENAGSRFALIPQKTMIAVGEVTDGDLQDLKKVLRTREVYSCKSL